MSSATSQTQGLLHFRLSLNQLFAIGTLKVREIVPYTRLTALPHSHEHVLGSASLRGQTISVIDMAAAVGYRPIAEDERDACSIIITDVSRQTVGFLVRGIDRITECRWRDIDPPPSTLGKDAYVTGVTRVDDKLIQLLDIEKLIASVFPDDEDRIRVSVSLPDQAILSQLKILLVDDSATARKQLSSALDSIEIDYQMASDGATAFKMMQQSAAAGQPVDVLVSDIEMPGLDGYELTFEVRSDPGVADAYIILHTSLSSEISVDRASQVGADEALTKFDAAELIDAMLRGAERVSDSETRSSLAKKNGILEGIF
ncbi:MULTISPECIES: chemotaxis protein [unclassified Agarivorans]|uniref:chemotaxis protein n=1 Tax=unclassified Agarivorans TaxID=2636026 RepID=UPI0010E3CEBF|nr:MULTISPECIES: chemotaxis protein [unclassified Agarivorans]MDO6685691.1 chemotaxis protein [Agarivorans sp. 3_MG-2023]MDO6716194.1 chemotaxis protein [Agarivorans sp. 2_MG-2023]GDY27307.1 chemotaxis protein CheW [Agarivorans sp. Toyoura001]